VSPNSVTSGAESSAVFSVSVKTGNGETVPTARSSLSRSDRRVAWSLERGRGHLFHCHSALGVGTYSVSATYSGDTNLSTRVDRDRN